MKVFKLAVLGILFFSFLSCAPGLVPPGWEFLGKRQVNFGYDHDAIAVPPGKGLLRQLMIVVTKNDLEMFDMRVTFERGDDFSPNLRLVFEKNTRSRVIDLPGGVRRVRRVDFRYKSLLLNERRADIELWGR
jgi:hypothetical protein